MQVPPIQPKPQPTFEGYKSPLKTLYKRNQLPQVKYGFYGERITPNTVSIEHLKPISKGGKTELKNLVLAHKNTNNLRSDYPLRDYLKLDKMAKYLEQFINIKVGDFDGNKYIAMILETVGGLLK